VIPARTRRYFLASLAASGGTLHFAPGVLAEQLVLTPRQTEGPFYPTKLPLDTDNDLILRGIRDAQARQSVIVPFAPVPQSTAGGRPARSNSHGAHAGRVPPRGSLRT
jgi:hypothetical protein